MQDISILTFLDNLLEFESKPYSFIISVAVILTRLFFATFAVVSNCKLKLKEVEIHLETMQERAILRQRSYNAFLSNLKFTCNSKVTVITMFAFSMLIADDSNTMF